MVRPTPKPITPARLEAIAYRHLERFASSRENLRRVLMRRVDRSARLHATDRAEGARAVAALIGALTDAGLLDDRRYAEARAARLHREGASSSKIAASLAGKGIERQMIADLLRPPDDDEPRARPGGDLAAAAALVRRRRLGPYRALDQRATHQMKDLAILARAGFSRAVAVRVLNAADPDALQDLVSDG